MIENGAKKKVVLTNKYGSIYWLDLTYIEGTWNHYVDTRDVNSVLLFRSPLYSSVWSEYLKSPWEWTLQEDQSCGKSRKQVKDELIESIIRSNTNVKIAFLQEFFELNELEHAYDLKMQNYDIELSSIVYKDIRAILNSIKENYIDISNHINRIQSKTEQVIQRVKGFRMSQLEHSQSLVFQQFSNDLKNVCKKL